MLDVKKIREETELVRKGLEGKHAAAKLDELLEIDKERRKLIVETDNLKAEKNSVSDKIGSIKKSGGNADELIATMKAQGVRLKEMDEQLKAIDAAFDKLMESLPNLPHESVPVGRTSDDNVEVRRWLPEGFSFENAQKPKDHLELGKQLNILDFERGTKISGSGFPLYKGKGATLERALINYMLDLHINEHGYSEIIPPLLVNSDSMFGTGQLPKMEEDMYYMERDGLWAIPTAEVPVTNIHRNEILSEKELPIKYVAYSPCFRREAGSYGKDSKGFLRTHQFNKVEMVKFVKPETSYNELELLVNDAEDILKALKIPYRILMLCTGDLSFAAAKCYDIETWSPAENKWLEASSCSNFESFQARRAAIKFRADGDKKSEFLHTLNGSGLATSRLMVSILENYQTPEGKIVVPEPLRKYTGFEIID